MLPFFKKQTNQPTPQKNTTHQPALIQYVYPYIAPKTISSQRCHPTKSGTSIADNHSKILFYACGWPIKRSSVKGPFLSACSHAEFFPWTLRQKTWPGRHLPLRPCKPSPQRILLWLREIRVAAPAVLFPLLPRRWVRQYCPTGRQPAGGSSQGNASASMISSIRQSTTVQWHRTKSSLDFCFFPAHFCKNHKYWTFLLAFHAACRDLCPSLTPGEGCVSHAHPHMPLPTASQSGTRWSVLDIFYFIPDKMTAGRAHQLPKPLLTESEQHIKLCHTLL